MKPADPLDIPLAGTQLIEASAGTGKTFTIALLYVRLVMEQDLGADEILVVTYTNAAAAELRERIRKRLQEAAHALEMRIATGCHEPRPKHSKLHEIVEASVARGQPEVELGRLRDALRGFDEAAISTIHGFCQRVLDENAFESGVSFDTELVPDQAALLDDVVADFWTRSLYDASPHFVAWLRANTRAGERIGPSLLSALAILVMQQPRVVIRPERAPDTGEPDLAHWHEKIDRVQEIWERDGVFVVQQLIEAFEADALNKNIFRPETLREKLAAEIDTFFEHPLVGGAQPGPDGKGKAGLARITRSAIAKGTKKGSEPPAHALFDAAEEFLAVDAECAACFDARFIALELELIEAMRDELARRRRLSGTRSFDDLLNQLADALAGERGSTLAEAIRRRFPAALIDEFQDTDPVQYEIFERVWHTDATPFFLIGDPKQAIYGFRGADVFAYMKAKRDAGRDAIGLDRNWRSDPGVVAGVNSLFRRVETPFLYDAIPFHEAVPAPDATERLCADDGVAGLHILVAGRPDPASTKTITKGRAKVRVASAVAQDIARLLGSGAKILDEPLRASDIAVLCRTNAQAQAIQQQLGRCGVASVMQTRQSVFETDEAAALERILAAAAEPTRRAALRAAITTTLVGVDAAALQAIDTESEGLDPWFESAAEWSRRLHASGVLALVEHILEAHGSRDRLLEAVGGERRITNLFHLAELMQTASHAATTSPRGLLRWLERMRRDATARAEDAGDDALIRLETDALAVQIVTIHRSKGLQYPVVYCPFLFEGRMLSAREKAWVKFHDPDDDDRLVVDLGSPDQARGLQHAQYEAFAEGLRILYVALTRAKHRAVVVWGPFNQAGHSALGLLLHPPPDLATQVAARNGDLPRLCDERLKKLDDTALRAELAELVVGSGGTITLAPLGEGSDVRILRAASAAPLVEARSLGRRILRQRRVASFSRLVADAERMHATAASGDARSSDDHPSAAGRDYDAEPLAGPLDAGTSVALADVSRAALDRIVPLHAFPAGAGPGTMIHAVFEHLDFSDPSPSALDASAHEALARFGMSESLAPALVAGLREALDAPLGGALAEFSLAELERRARIDELEFTLPVALAGGQRLSPARLGDALARHAESPSVRAYAERVRSLGFPEMAGHLRGFIDLVFRHAGRFYLADYKSNHLGPTFNHYSSAILDTVMPEHDYTLQYHLYTLALHRFLSTRVPGYSYAEHFGGVYYLFVRGMSPRAPIGQGVFHDRPPEALVDALSQVLGDVDGRSFREIRA